MVHAPLYAKRGPMSEPRFTSHVRVTREHPPLRTAELLETGETVTFGTPGYQAPEIARKSAGQGRSPSPGGKCRASGSLWRRSLRWTSKTRSCIAARTMNGLAPASSA